ncbi:MAG: hypothetical protein Q9181_006652 [Wetmoreana brouardii]
MSNTSRARFQKCAHTVVAAGLFEEGQTRGQERKRKDDRPTARSRPDAYPSYSAYAESSTPQASQGSQQPGSGWYGPPPTTHPPYASSLPLQQHQQQQQAGYVPQNSSYYASQTLGSGQQSANAWGASAPGAYGGHSLHGQHPPAQGYTQYQTPQYSTSPLQAHSPPLTSSNFSQQPSHPNTYGHQLYNQAPQHSPPPPQGQSPPHPQGNYPQQHQYSPPPPQGQSPPHPQGNYPQQHQYSPSPSTRSLSYISYGSTVPAPERCVHGQVIGRWYPLFLLPEVPS